MTCQCICKCKQDASEDANRIPELCLACNLMDALCSPRHGMTYTPPAPIKLEPLAKITDEQKDRAIDKAMGGLI